MKAHQTEGKRPTISNYKLNIINQIIFHRTLRL